MRRMALSHSSKLCHVRVAGWFGDPRTSRNTESTGYAASVLRMRSFDASGYVAPERLMIQSYGRLLS